MVEGDNLGLKLMDRLEKEFSEIEFIEVDAIEDLQNYGSKLKIIDAVVEIDEVRVLKLDSLEDFDKIEIGRVYSMHDFDLGYNLKLLKKMKLIDSVEIICLPVGGGENEVFEKVCGLVRGMVGEIKIIL